MTLPREKLHADERRYAENVRPSRRRLDRLLAAPVTEVMSADPLIAERACALTEARKRLGGADADLMLVCDGVGRLAGVVDGGDLLAAVLKHREYPPDELTVGAAARSPYGILEPEERVRHAISRLGVVGVSQTLVVVDAETRPLGVVGPQHLLHHLVELMPKELANPYPEPTADPPDRIGG